MQHLPLQWLEALLIFADSPSMLIAAQRLGITQPALSKQLGALAKEMPLPLFAQEGKRKTLTNYGKELVEELRPRLSGIESSLRQVNLKHLEGSKTEIRICARREILDRLAPHLKFEGQIVFMEASHLEVVEHLNRRECDLGITHAAPDSTELTTRPLFRENFQFVVPKIFLKKLPAEDKLKEQLEKLPCASYRPKDEVLEAACDFLKLDIRKLKIVRITDNYSSLFRITEAGLAWSVLPTQPFFESPHTWQIPIPQKWIASREFRLLYRKELVKARWMKDLLINLTQVF